MQTQKFTIALSFANEDRTLAEAIANELIEQGITVFYDAFHQHELWGRNLQIELGSVYKDRCDYVVVFLSKAYHENMWTSYERQIIMDRYIKNMTKDHILPLRVNGYHENVPGFVESLCYVELNDKNVNAVVELLQKKIHQVQGFPQSSTVTKRPKPKELIAIAILFLLIASTFLYSCYQSLFKSDSKKANPALQQSSSSDFEQKYVLRPEDLPNTLQTSESDTPDSEKTQFEITGINLVPLSRNSFNRHSKLVFKNLKTLDDLNSEKLYATYMIERLSIPSRDQYMVSDHRWCFKESVSQDSARELLDSVNRALSKLNNNSISILSQDSYRDPSGFKIVDFVLMNISVDKPTIINRCIISAHTPCMTLFSYSPGMKPKVLTPLTCWNVLVPSSGLAIYIIDSPLFIPTRNVALVKVRFYYLDSGKTVPGDQDILGFDFGFATHHGEVVLNYDFD